MQKLHNYIFRCMFMDHFRNW